jgi:plastocyanin domain-containing protein
MTSTDWLAVTGGAAAIAWINWYFFLAERRTVRATAGAGGVQEVRIAVHGGYEPAAVRVERGRPVRLVFDRQETSSCSEEIVIGDFGVRKFLPPFQKTVIELTPATPGRFDFQCGMGMLHGTLVVEP